MTISEKIKIVRDEFCNGSNTEFAKIMGEKPNTTSNWINRGASPDIGEAVLLKFPEVSRAWMLADEGNMLNSTEKEKNNVTPVPEDDYMMVEFEDLETAAGKLGCGEISVLPEKKTRLVPREYEKGDYLVVRVHGQSMNDGTGRSIYEDDELLIKQYYDSHLNMPIRTKLFVITTREGSVVKQITKVNKESNTITCHSFNPLYEDYEIGIEELLQVFTVEKKVKSKIIF